MFFYTYLWLRYDGTPYYVGKGSGSRAYSKYSRLCLPPRDKAFILIQEFPDEESAFAAERLLISLYGRLDNETGCLRNRTDGGEGCSGFSEITRRKISESSKGKKMSTAARLKMSLAARSRIVSEEIRNKKSELAKRLGIKPPVGSHKGFKHSEESKRKMSIALKGKIPWNKGRKEIS